MKYHHIIFIIIVFWLGSDGCWYFIFFCACFTSFHTHASLLTFCIFISFLLFPCASVWENTHAWVLHFLSPYWMVVALFLQCNYKYTMCIWSKKVEILDTLVADVTTGDIQNLLICAPMSQFVTSIQKFIKNSVILRL